MDKSYLDFCWQAFREEFLFSDAPKVFELQMKVSFLSGYIALLTPLIEYDLTNNLQLERDEIVKEIQQIEKILEGGAR